MPLNRSIVLVKTTIILSLLGFILSCSNLSTTQNVALVAGSAAVIGGYSPNNEIQQIYYLGVLDPTEQLPPAVYRVRVHGQSSFISQTRFASGWVRADLIDSLGTNVTQDMKSGRINFEKAGGDQGLNLQTGRRLILFGPEGFREAPKDHRLVIMMGSNPENFFKAIDQSLEVISEVRAEQFDAELDRLLFEAMIEMENEKERLNELAKDNEIYFSQKQESQP